MEENKLSPLEEAKKLNEENKILFEKMQNERQAMEKLAGDLAVSGRSTINSIPEKTEDEKINESVKGFLSGFRKIK